MTNAHSLLVFPTAAMTGVLIIIILLSLQVDAQSTVDGRSASSCESSALDEAVNVIREELKDVMLIRDDLREVKSACGSRQQQQQQSNEDVDRPTCASSAICEYTYTVELMSRSHRGMRYNRARQ